MNHDTITLDELITRLQALRKSMPHGDCTIRLVTDGGCWDGKLREIEAQTVYHSDGSNPTTTVTFSD
jgi:hypothetical protein